MTPGCMRALLVVACALLVPDDAEACKCNDPGLASNMTWAKSAFVGTVTEVKTFERCSPNTPKSWCRKQYVHEMTVEGVWKGAPGKTVTLDSGTGTGDCTMGRDLGKGKPWLIFVRDDGPTHEIRICAGNQLATPRVLDAMTKRFGAPKPPA
jgi:hypothetical protein